MNTEFNKDKEQNAQWQHDLEASKQLAIDMARIAHDRHCKDIVILDLNDRSPVARYFVIATGTSSQQVKAVADEIETAGKHSGNKAYGNAGLQEGRWAVVDFVDVIVHVFDQEFRNFYDLEMLWGDAPRIEWKREGEDDTPKSGFGPGVEIH